MRLRKPPSSRLANGTKRENHMESCQHRLSIELGCRPFMISNFQFTLELVRVHITTLVVDAALSPNM